MGKEKGVDVLKLIVGLMVVGYGGALVKGGKLLLSISLSWWGMVLIFCFGMINGRGMFLSKFFILNYLCSANKEACISEVLSPSMGDNDRVWSLRF